MAQIKIYGLASRLSPARQALSDAIHSCVVEALALPADKRFHRFFPLAPEPFQPPNGWKPGQAPVVPPWGRLA